MISLARNLSARPSLRAGARTAVQDTMLGPVLSLSQRDQQWRHPWFVRPIWVGGRWVCTVRPGFVNGRCPAYRTSAGEQAGMPGERTLLVAMSGREGSGTVLVAVDDERSDAQVDVPLYLEPAISLNFHAVKAIPRFFADRGAFNPPSLTEQLAAEALGEELPDAGSVPERFRILRACDVWIHQPRLALTSAIEFQAGFATGISNVKQTLSVRGATPGDALRVMSGTLRTIEGIQILDRVFEEPNYDELLIATVFLLSPYDTPAEAEPDGRWQPFVEHNLFWNLNHITPWFRDLGGDLTPPILPPLAGGVAQLIFNFSVASISDMLNDALNLVTAHSMAGTFYTSTGGGHSAKMPEAAIAARGIDRASRLQRDQAQRNRARNAAELNPDFPYRAEPFDPALLKQRT